jgi:Uma2 family endonuclease
LQKRAWHPAEARSDLSFVPLDHEKQNTMSIALNEQQRYTPDDLLALPEAERFELVDGQLVERARGFKSSRIRNCVNVLLANHCNQHQLGWVLGSDTGDRCFSDDGDKVRKPDVSFVAACRLKADEEPEGFATFAPDLAVEVISPTELFEDVMVKVSEFLDAGVKLVWVIDPATNRVHVYRADGGTILDAKDQLDGEAVLPGFRCAIVDLFVPPAGTV